MDFCGESSCCWTLDSHGLQILGLPGLSSRRFSWLESAESASSLVISCSLRISTLADLLFTSAFRSVIVFTTSRASDSRSAASCTVKDSSSCFRSAGVMVWVRYLAASSDLRCLMVLGEDFSGLDSRSSLVMVRVLNLSSSCLACTEVLVKVRYLSLSTCRFSLGESFLLASGVFSRLEAGVVWLESRGRSGMSPLSTTSLPPVSVICSTIDSSSKHSVTSLIVSVHSSLFSTVYVAGTGAGCRVTVSWTMVTMHC